MGKRQPQVPLHMAWFFNLFLNLSGETFPPPANQESTTLKMKLNNTHKANTNEYTFGMTEFCNMAVIFVLKPVMLIKFLKI